MIDLYTFASFIVGILAGCLVGAGLAWFISSHKVEHLEQKVHALSDTKFKLKGQKVRLKQLEQRLDAEAASIPLAERELRDRSGEIRELTTALNETTALTGELADALRQRKAKVQLLQIEQSKWIKRNKALLLKTEQLGGKISGMQKEIAVQRNANEKLEKGTVTNGTATTAMPTSTPAVAEPVTSAAQAFLGSTNSSSPAGLHSANDGESANGDSTVDRLTSRMQEMETELQNWFDRVGTLEKNVTGQNTQATGLAMLEEVLRGEADKQNAAASNTQPHLLGRHGAS